MKHLIWGLLATLVLAGCGAGTAYELLERDAVIAAATEAKKGVLAFNQAVEIGTAMSRAEMVRKVGEGVYTAALATSTPEEAAAIAKRSTGLLLDHIANYMEQERRRANLLEVTLDNLDYIIQISQDGKQFALYRSDVTTQWKQYITSTARGRIGAVTSIQEGN